MNIAKEEKLIKLIHGKDSPNHLTIEEEDHTITIRTYMYWLKVSSFNKFMVETVSKFKTSILIR